MNTTVLTIACVVFVTVMGSAGLAYAQTAYISDNLTVPLRSGTVSLSAVEIWSKSYSASN